MRVLLCPDKFRGTFTAAEVCSHLSRGMREADSAIVIDAVPMADGGEGTMEAVLSFSGGTLAPCRVQGPAGEWIESCYGVTGSGVAILEAARFCGLGLIDPARRDPLRATSAGLGQAIAEALEAGMRRLAIGLGGTATIDGGAGMARALGFRLLDRGGAALTGAPADLDRLDRIDPLGAHPDLEGARFLALCDVQNPVLGPEGAVAVFGPQKGVTAESAPQFDRALAALAAALGRWRGDDPGRIAARAGAGAAGGLGMGLAGFLGADLTPGAPWLMREAGLRQRIESADLVVTGEGSLDRQTSGGKLVAAVLMEAARARKPAVVVTGRWDGTLPPGRPDRTEVLAGVIGADGSTGMGPGELASLGRRIAGFLP